MHAHSATCEYSECFECEYSDSERLLILLVHVYYNIINFFFRSWWQFFGLCWIGMGPNLNQCHLLILLFIILYVIYICLIEVMEPVVMMLTMWVIQFLALCVCACSLCDLQFPQLVLWVPGRRGIHHVRDPGKTDQVRLGMNWRWYMYCYFHTWCVDKVRYIQIHVQTCIWIWIHVQTWMRMDWHW